MGAGSMSRGVEQHTRVLHFLSRRFFNKTLFPTLFAAVLAVFFCSSGKAPLDKSLVLCFNFDEEKGDVVKDVSQ